MIRRFALGAVTLGVVLAISASTAMAARLTVARAIVAQDKLFVTSPGYKLLEKFNVKSAAQAKIAIPKLEHTRKLLERAATVVEKASARTFDQKTGRRDWVTGAHLVADGIGELATGLDYLVKGNKTKANQVLQISIRTDRRGGVFAAKGDKLLGLPSTD